MSRGAPYGIASGTNPTLGVKQGDLYGPAIDIGKLVAYETGNLLGTPISPEFVLCLASDDGWFSTIYNCLAERDCDISIPTVPRFPVWEKKVDYTCNIYQPNESNVSAIGSTPTIDAEFTGTICSVKGSAQYLVASQSYPKANYLYYNNAEEMWVAFCARKCQYVVDDIFTISRNICSHNDIQLPPWSPTGDIGAITLKN